MQPDETAFRCNVVTLTENGLPYEEETIIDHSADEITTAEADELMKALNEHLGTDYLHFYTGVSYRHCILWQNAPESRTPSRKLDLALESRQKALSAQLQRQMGHQGYDNFGR